MPQDTHEEFNASRWLLDRWVDDGDGERVAVVTGDRSLTYAEMLTEVERAAAGFRALASRD